MEQKSSANGGNSGGKSGRKFKVSHLQSRFADKVKESPFSKEQAIDEWMQTVCICSGLSESEFKRAKSTVLFITTFYPFCVDIKRFENLFKLGILLFVIDDLGDSREKSVGQTLWAEMVMGCDKVKTRDSSISMTKWKPCTLLGYALIEAICEDFNETQRKRVCDLFKKNYQYQSIELGKIEEGLEKLSFAEMRRIRMESSGCDALIQCNEFAVNLVLTEDEWTNDKMQRFITLCVECIVYVNDVLSFEKEYRHFNGNINKMFNVVSQMLILDKRLDIEEAINKAIEELKEIENNCQQCADDMTNDPGVSTSVKTFVECALYLLGGNYYSHITVDRYNKLE